MYQPGPAQRIAPYVNRQSLILVGGLLLMVLNLLGSAEGQTVLTAFNPNYRPATASATHTSVVDLGAQLVLLLVLILIASLSDEGGTFALIFLAALWLGWLFMNRAWFAGLASLAPSHKSG